MKLTAIFLLAGCLSVAARGIAQKVTVKAVDQPLKKVLKDLEKQSGYQFFYSDNDMRLSHTVTVNAEGRDFSEVLGLCFRDQPLTYEIVDKTVVIKQKEAPKKENPIPLEAGNPSPPPPSEIHGRVVDTTGEPLANAAVSVKGTRHGTQTGADGKFSLTYTESNITLIISYTGFQTREFIPGSDNSVLIVLHPSTNTLDEVVSKGYYKTSQRFNTGNVVKVDGKDIEKQPVTDPLQALEGRVAGLSITQTSGVPGAYGTVKLRGQNTITLGGGFDGKLITANDPLFIIDGVPFSSQTLSSPFLSNSLLDPSLLHNLGSGLSPFNSLNPADIESIEVLKDADATAIYGSRGANGVILITTRKGRVGNLRTDVSVNSGFSKIIHYFDLLNTQQYLGMRIEALKNANQLSLLNPANITSFADIMLWDTTRYSDWQKMLIGKPAQFSDANISLSGGTTTSQFSAGAGYNRQGTTMPGDYSDQRLSLHLNMSNSSADKRFNSELSASYSHENNSLPTTNLVPYILLAPNAPAVYDANGNLNWALYNGNRTWANPFSYVKQHSKSVTDYLSGNGNLSYQLLPGLIIKSTFGYSHSQLNTTGLSPSSSKPPPNNNNPASRFSSFSTTNTSSWIFEPQINYTRKISKGRVDLLLGSTFSSSSYDSRTLSASGFASDALITNIQAATTISVLGSTETVYHYNAVYGRLGYIYDEKYLLNLTTRRDGSSRFGPGKQFGNFGAVGAGWIFSKEDWMIKHFPVISFGKLRASYGTTGNDGIQDYQFMSTYSAAGYSYQNSPALIPTLLFNPDIRWEEVRKLEAGLELGLFKDRINLTASRYRNRTTNQLVTAPLSAVTGFAGVIDNLPALIQNTGWEFTLNITAIKTIHLNWSMTGNVAIERNELVSFPGIENTPYFGSYFVGHPLGTLNLYHYIGVDPQTGVYQFATANGNGIPAFSDRFLTKPLTPSWFGGLENSFSYKGIQLQFNFQFVKQMGYNYLRNIVLPGSNNSGINFQTNLPAEVLNRWQNPGDITYLQKFASLAVTSSAFTNFTNSDGVITDASFIRLKSASLSYNLPERWLHNMHFANGQVYINCQNVFTLTHYRGLDPETQGLSMPPVRTIVGGFRLSF